MVSLLALAGCVFEQTPPAELVGAPMQSGVDTSVHPLVNPPTRHRQGRVDQDDLKADRSLTIGPQSLLIQPKGLSTPPGGVLAPDRLARLALDDRLAQLPLSLRNFVALAGKRSRHKSSPDSDDATDPSGAPDGGDTPASFDEIENADTSPVSASDQGYRLNFENTEIKDVLQAVLGHTLGLNYTIASSVSGRISIASAAPQSREELLSTLETVLSLQGLVMTKTGSLYRITPASVDTGTVDYNSVTPGFGISVVPLHYASVNSISHLLSGFLTDADGVRIDTSLNAIIVRGPGVRRAEIVRAVRTFDRDWTHTQTVAVVELRRSQPDDVISELSRIFDTDQNGAASGVLQFKAIKRMRAIMVISQNSSLVHRAVAWARRLDHHDLSQTAAIFVFRPRYRDARELARVVTSLFNGGSGSNDLDSKNNSNSPSQKPAGSGGSGGAGGGSSVAFAGSLGSSSFGSGSPGGFGSGSPGTGGLGSSFGGGSGGGQGTSGSSGGSKSQSNESNDLLDDKGAGGEGKLKLVADTSNNTIVTYTDGDTYRKVHSILSQLDVPPLQVAINVVIAEVQLTDELKYGVQTYLRNHTGSIGLASAATNTIGRYLPGANLVLGRATSPEVVISALDSISKVHILSTPSVVVMENKTASFEVGNQVPVITQQAQSNTAPDAPTVNSVNYVDTGIILKIVPRIGQDGSVVLDLDQIISNVVQGSSGGTSTSDNSTNALTPTISKRHIASDISVRSGQTVLLAGLINDNRQDSRGQLPWVGPTLGNVLGNTDNQYTRDELVIFINPVIIRDGMDASRESQRFQEKLKTIHDPAPEQKP
jgi:general secretion pathway protein D